MSKNSRLSYSPSSSSSFKTRNLNSNDDNQIGNLNDHLNTANAAQPQPPAPECLADQPEISISVHELPASPWPQSSSSSSSPSSGYMHMHGMQQQEENIIKTKKRRGGRKRRPKSGTGSYRTKSDPMINIAELDSIPISTPVQDLDGGHLMHFGNVDPDDHYEYHNGYYSSLEWYPYHNVEVDREIYPTRREETINHNYPYEGYNYDHPSTNGGLLRPPKGSKKYGGGWGKSKRGTSGGGKKVRFMLDPEAPVYNWGQDIGGYSTYSS